MTRLLTMKAAAKEAGIGYDTLRRAVAGGYCRIVMLPGQKTPMLDPADVDAFIESSKLGSIPVSIATMEELHPADFKGLNGARLLEKKRQVANANLPYYERFKSNGKL